MQDARMARWMVLGVVALVAAGCGGSSGETDDGGGGDVPGDADVAPDGDDGGGGDPGEVPPDGDDDTTTDGGGDADAPDVADDGGPTGGPVGAACAAGGDCLDGPIPAECVRSLVGLTFPDGYCTALGCHGDADCVGGATEAVCYPGAVAGLSWCADRCDPAASDCRAGYVCLDPDGPLPLSAACLPVCRTEADCEAGEICDNSSGYPICRPTTGGANGAACASTADCAPGSSCAAEDLSFVGGFPGSGPPGGLCIQECLADAECTNGGVCVMRCDDADDTAGNDCDDDGTPGLDPEANGICMEACDPADGGACPRTGYRCRAVGENVGGPRQVCTVDCSEGGGGCTLPGRECDPSAGYGTLEYGAGRCQVPFDPDRLGRECTATEGCEGGTCLAEAYTGMPGGLCVEECLGGGGSADGCPTGSVCLARAGEIGGCVTSCTPGGTDCRDGWACVRVVIFDVCRPSCDDNAECDYGCCRPDDSGYCDPSRTSCL